METKAWGLTPNELAQALGGMTVQGVYRILKQKGANSSLPTGRKIIPAQFVRDVLIERGYRFKSTNFSFQIVKGGAGKTSISSNFALRASQYGAKVLMVDFDQQGNLTTTFGVDTTNKPVFIDLFRGDVDVKDSVVKIHDFLHVIPSSLDNSRLDVEMTQRASLNIKDLIRDMLAPVRDQYDIVVMDCPPAINKINVAVACSSDLVVIPINPEQYSMDGMEFTISELEQIKKDFKIYNLDYRIVWNKYDARERLGTVYMHHLAKDENKLSKVLPVVIRTDTSLKNSVYEATNVFEATRGRKKAVIREDLDQLTRELIGINQWVELKAEEKREVLA